MRFNAIRLMGIRLAVFLLDRISSFESPNFLKNGLL